MPGGDPHVRALIRERLLPEDADAALHIAQTYPRELDMRPDERGFTPFHLALERASKDAAWEEAYSQK